MIDRYEPLKLFVEELKANGFTVVTSSPETNYSYCFFSKNNKIGYVQYDYISGFSFSSVHKPNSQSGTGFSIARNVDIATIKLAKEAMNLHAWTGYSVTKYDSLNDYIKRNSTILQYHYL